MLKTPTDIATGTHGAEKGFSRRRSDKNLRALFLFILIFTGAIVVGAIIAWPVYEVCALFMDVPFRKVLSRTTLLTGLALSLTYLAYSHRLSFESLGLSGRLIYKPFLIGLGAGLLLMAIIEINLLLLGIHKLDPHQQYALASLLTVLLKGVITGMLVALVEETIFRGALLGGLAHRTNNITALITVSLFYAGVHYIKFRDLPADADINLLTGVTMLPEALIRFTYISYPGIYDGFLTLFLLGLFLGIVRILTSSLIPCIGIHAGIVMGERIVWYVADHAPDNPYQYLVNYYDPFIGYLSSAWLVAFILSYYLLHRKYVISAGHKP